MNKNELISRVRIAVGELLNNDSYLFRINVAERTFCGRLASYLQENFPDYFVDVEYNRHGVREKALLEIKNCVRENRQSGVLTDKEEEFGISVSPDIIIHRRGESGPNLLVIEVKKEGNPIEYDDPKIRAYRKELEYEYGMFIVVKKTSPYISEGILYLGNIERCETESVLFS